MRDKPTVFNYQKYEEAVADILEEVKAEMCEQYCKYPDWYKDITEDE